MFVTKIESQKFSLKEKEHFLIKSFFIFFFHQPSTMTFLFEKVDEKYIFFIS